MCTPKLSTFTPNQCKDCTLTATGPGLFLTYYANARRTPLGGAASRGSVRFIEEGHTMPFPSFRSRAALKPGRIDESPRASSSGANAGAIGARETVACSPPTRRHRRGQRRRLQVTGTRKADEIHVDLNGTTGKSSDDQRSRGRQLYPGRGHRRDPRQRGRRERHRRRRSTVALATVVRGGKGNDSITGGGGPTTSTAKPGRDTSTAARVTTRSRRGRRRQRLRRAGNDTSGGDAETTTSTAATAPTTSTAARGATTRRRGRRRPRHRRTRPRPRPRRPRRRRPRRRLGRRRRRRRRRQRRRPRRRGTDSCDGGGGDDDVDGDRGRDHVHGGDGSDTSKRLRRRP